MWKRLLSLFACALVCMAVTGCSIQYELDGMNGTVPVSQDGQLDIPAQDQHTDPAAASDASAPSAPSADAGALQPAEAYLVVTAGGAVYEPIPLVNSGKITLRRGDLVNVIQITPTSICMAESNCANQDCVEQGEVTLENKDKRVLQNMIICLPNDIALELYTYDELLEVMSGWLGGQAE